MDDLTQIKMTKAKVISEIAKSTGVTKKDVHIVVDSFFETIKRSLEKGEYIYIRKFGGFFSKKKAPKVARNIKKNTSIFIDAHYVPFFQPSKFFVERIKASKKIKA